MSEFDLINRFFKPEAVHRDDVKLGIGDDCAILDIPHGKQLCVSTDTLIAGVHFPDTTSARDIGHKALAVNLSDLAAMGAEPAWVSLALTLPEYNPEWLQGFIDGFNDLASRYNVSLIGGDTTRGHLTITVQVFGLIKEGQAMRRDRAHADQLIYVTGTLGDAGLGLHQVMGQINQSSLDYCVQRLNRPEPRIDIARELVNLSDCAIDISDGLIADLGHILERSQCGAELQLQDIPLSDEVKRYYGEQIDWCQILGAGDDYELCFTCDENKAASLQTLARKQGIAITCIGRVTTGSDIICVDANGNVLDIQNMGYNHFND